MHAPLIQPTAPDLMKTRRQSDLEIEAQSSAQNSSPAGIAPTLSKHIDQNIESIVALQKREWETVGAAQRRVETIGRWLGRPLYLVGLLVAIAFWVGINVMRRAREGWDPPPFELLDGVMTLISLVTTTIVLIAQNRQTKLEQQHTHLGLQVSLLTEQKVTKLIKLIEELRRDMPMVRDRRDPHAEALQESADTAKVVAALEEGGATPSAKEAAPVVVAPTDRAG
jgi:uncharacterized membrane protein